MTLTISASERVKRWRKDHHDKFLAQRKVWRSNNRLRIKMYMKEWNERHPDAGTIRSRKYRSKYPERARRQGKEYCRQRYSTDINFKISHNLRRALNRSIRYGGVSAVRDLGCSIDEFKQHLESKFKPGMSWGNYGQFGWHIDHIRPLVSFDLTKRSQLLKAVHYTNLQPLWWNQNLSKGDRNE